MTKMTADVELAQGLARDGASGLESVYLAYSAKLYTYALTMLRDPASAQDVVHDALLVAAGSIGQLREPSKFRPWLYAITRNECLRTLRGRKRFSDSEVGVDVPDQTIDFDAGLRREEASQLIAQAMAAMSPADRDIVTLALLHDLDADRISEVTGSTPNTVHARLSRARAGLSDAVSALALYRTRDRCDELRAFVSDQPLTPLLRKRIQRHVKACDECETRRRAALVAIGPAIAAPMFVSPPDVLAQRILVGWRSGAAAQLAERAAPFDEDGFPIPLDAKSRSKWLLPAAMAGVGLLIVAFLVVLLAGGDGQTPTAQSTPIATSASAPPPTSSALPSPTLTQAVTAEPTPTFKTPKATPKPPIVAPAQTPAKTPTPTPTKTTPNTPKPTSTKKESPSKTPKPTASTPSTAPPTDPEPAPPAPEPPTITSATLTNEDQADDGSFTRCDAFTLRINATVTGTADTTEAVITPTDSTAVLTGDPLQAKITLPPGEYSVVVKASGPGGTATRDAGTVLHICPG